MTTATIPLEIDVKPDLDRAHAGVDFPIVIGLTLAPDYQQSVHLRNIACSDKDVFLDTDLIQRNVEIRPGETYRCTVHLNVKTQREVDLSCLRVELTDFEELIQAPRQLLQIRPSLKEIEIFAEPICSYGDVHKMQLTFTHKGRTTFENLRIQLQPENVVRAGKHPVLRQVFGPEKPDNTESVIVAVTGATVVVSITAVVDGVGLHHEESIPVPVASENKSEPFQFLEPRSLSRDKIEVYEAFGEKDRVEEDRSAFPLVGRCRYEIFIEPPRDRDVKKIELRDIPEMVNIRQASEDKNSNAWRFEIDVSYRSLFRKSEKLHYAVQTADDILTGEIHITLKPAWHRRWIVAGTLGIALTIQGVAAFATRLLNPDYPLGMVFQNFQWSRDYPLVFIPVIPALWFILWAGDRIWYRLWT